MKKQFKVPNEIKGKAVGPIILAIAPTSKKKSNSNEEEDEEEEEEEEGEEDEEIELDSKAEVQKFVKNAQKLAKELGTKASKAELKSIETQVAALTKAIEDQNQEKTDSAIKSINNSFTKLWDEVVEKRENDEDATKGGQSNRNNPAALNAKARETFLKSLKDEDGDIIRGKNASLTIKAAEILNKAAETFGYQTTFVSGTDMTAFTGREVDPTLYQRRRKRNIILDLFTIRPIAVPSLFYLSKVEEGDANPVAGDPGGADWILCGDPKPKRSFRVKAEKVEAKKVAIFGTIEDCLLHDVPSFDNWIEEDFRDELNEKFNDGLLNNNPDTGDENAPLGVKTKAVQFAVTPAFAQSIEDANEIDAIFAAAAAMAVSREQPAYMAVSVDRYYRILALKDNNSRYQNNDKIYTDSTGNLWIGGVMLYPADVEDIPSTHFMLVGAESGFKIRLLEDAVLETGLNGEDFRQDKTSYRGYMRVLSYIPEHRENSIMYDTWANVIAAITKPAAPAEPEA